MQFYLLIIINYTVFKYAIYSLLLLFDMSMRQYPE
jgi:hypothetical protein